MIFLYCPAGLILLLAAGGAVLLVITSLRGKTPDYWVPGVAEAKGWGSVAGSIAAGRAWFLKSAHETVTIRAKDGIPLVGEVIPQENAKGVLILFHGWRSSWKLDFSSVLQVFYEMGYQLVITEQRGTGRSGGKFITFGVRESEDAECWVEYAAQRFGTETDIFLDGISMGASTVLMTADREMKGNVKGILADCGFCSPYDEFYTLAKQASRLIPARLLLWVLNLFTRLFAGYGLREKSTVTVLRHSRYPVFLLHGTADTFVSCEMSKRNYEACTSYRELLLIEGAGHGMSYVKEPERVKEAIGAFLKYCRNEKTVSD